jgi:hypothetical protein
MQLWEDAVETQPKDQSPQGKVQQFARWNHILQLCLPPEYGHLFPKQKEPCCFNYV